MGKKSLTKSTTKKKSKKTKKSADAPVKSAASKKKQTASAGSSLTPPLDRQFDEWAPKKPWKPKPDKTHDKNFSATPVVKGKSKEANRIRELLLASVDLEAPAPGKPEKNEKPQKATKAETKKPRQAKAKPASKKKPSIKELIALRFDTWQPEKPFVPETGKTFNFTAPPAFEGVDRSIVLKAFDLSVPDNPKEAPKAEKSSETEAPAPEASTVADSGPPEETTAEAEAAEEKPEPAEAEKTIGDPMPADEEPAEKPTESEVEPKPPKPETKEEETVKAPEAEEEKTPGPELAPEHEPKPEPETTAAAKQTPEEKPEVSEPDQKETAEKGKEAAKEAKAPPAVSAQVPPPEEPPADEPGGGGEGGDGGDGGDDVPPEPPREPLLGRGTKILVATLGVIFLILIATSIANNQRYTLKDTRDGVEILRGDFSPSGKSKIAFLPGATIPEDMQEATNRKDAMRFAYNHHMEKVVQLMDDRDISVDLSAIRDNLEKAKDFAFTAEKEQAVKKRLRQVDFAMLIYRADVAMSEDTREGYEGALEYLDRASELDIESGARIEILEYKTNLAKSRLKEIMPKEPEDEPLKDEPSEDEKPEDADPDEETETGSDQEDSE